MDYVISNLHWFVLLLGGLVFFHELGHFLVAKWCGVKVLRFSLGFGPKIVGFTYGETEYWLSLLPLGGYVKMLGEQPEDEASISHEDAARAFVNRPVWQRACIALAGPVFNLLLAFFVYQAMFVGAGEVGDTRLGVVERDGAAWQAGIRPGDRVIAINGKATETWTDLRRGIGDSLQQPITMRVSREGEADRDVTVRPLAVVETDALGDSSSRGRIGVSLQYVKPVLAVVDPSSPAAAVGLQSGDIIASIDGNKIQAWHEVQQRLRRVLSGATVKLSVLRNTLPMDVMLKPDAVWPEGMRPDLGSAADASGGYTGLVSMESVVSKVDENTPAASAEIKPGDRLVEVTFHAPNAVPHTRAVDVWTFDLASLGEALPGTEVDVLIQRGRELMHKRIAVEVKDEQDELKQSHKVRVIGMQNDTSLLGTYSKILNVGFFDASARAFIQVGDDASLIGRGVAKLFSGGVPLDTVGGPIMLFVVAEKSAKHGWSAFFRTLAMISVNLGLLNLLPVPVLDGGHLVFLAIEAVMRKPASVRMREIANSIGMALLLMLMLLAFKNDIVRYVLG